MSLFRKSKKSSSNQLSQLENEVDSVLKISDPNASNLNWDPEKIELKEGELRSFIHPVSLRETSKITYEFVRAERAVQLNERFS